VIQLTKFTQVLEIPYSALASIIFGLMFLTFPIGAYIVFNSEVGDKINFEYPLENFNLFFAGIGFEIPLEFEIGDVFIVLWCTFLILFAIAIFGPKKDFLKVLGKNVTDGKNVVNSNYLSAMIKWFVILIVISGIVNFIQEQIGITTIPPESTNNLIRFFDVSVAPLSEEFGFRVMLIGLPIFAMYSHKFSINSFVKSLWHPSENLQIFEYRKALFLIAVVGIFFGAAHIITGEPWTTGKFAQAAASGIILGWVYFKHGLVSAILVHWATNYFIFSYVLLIADINELTIQNAFSHSLMSTLEVLLVIAGILSLVILFVNYINSKRNELKI